MKKSLIFALALMLVLAFATSAMAAQSFVPSSTDGLEHDYLSTTATGMNNKGPVPAGSTLSRTYQINKFVENGITNYPYEIYLPDELRPDTYRIHSSYAKNTDACASCHSTHTAVGNYLLQWYSTYETCMACHDGTVTTTYDVASGMIGKSGKAAMGGAFNGTGENASNHNVTGSMAIAAAPGGSLVETTVTLSSGDQKRWTPNFGCESCHSPHGAGGNARILNADPNFAASDSKAAFYVIDANKVYAVADTTYSNPLYILKQYPYTLAFQDASGNPVTGPTISNKTGVSVVTGSATRVIGTAALTVTMNIGHYLGLDGQNETVQHVYGMNAFCGACHTDYNTAAFTASDSATQETGKYSKAHRHQVGVKPLYNTATNLEAAGMVLEGEDVVLDNNKLECLTCHVAHGVSDEYWKNTIGTQSTTALKGRLTAPYFTDDSLLVELAGSSALKRIPNMGTCEACHQKGAGAEGYDINSGTNPDGLSDVKNTGRPNTYNYMARAWNYDASDLGWVGSAKCVPCHEEYVAGWEKTGHATSSHTGAGGCGQCHDPGNSLMAPYVGKFAPVPQWTTSQAAAEAYLLNNPFSQASIDVAGSTYLNGADIGITCESCHGTAKNHIAAPSAKNIFNPGTTSIKRQAMECGRCHDMYKNIANDAQGELNIAYADSVGTLSAKSGMASTPTSATTAVYKLDDIAALNNFSIAYRVYGESPSQFANATQKTAVSSHYGGAWGYADSKHYLGTATTADNANGVVSCNTCHDMHSDKHEGGLKYSYDQICSSCHDASANLAQAIAMPKVSWNRHQLELRDFAHSFQFGPAAAVATVQVTPVNLEKGVIGLPGTPDTVTVPGKNYFYSLYDDIYGNKTVDWTSTAGRTKTFSNWNLWRSATSAGGIGMKIVVKDASNTQVFNNYDFEWKLTAYPNTLTLSTATVPGDITFEEGIGAIEFAAPATADKKGAVVGNLAAYYAKYTGNYTVQYTTESGVVGTVTFSIKPIPDPTATGPNGLWSSLF